MMLYFYAFFTILLTVYAANELQFIRTKIVEGKGGVGFNICWLVFDLALATLNLVFLVKEATGV